MWSQDNSSLYFVLHPFMPRFLQGVYSHLIVARVESLLKGRENRIFYDILFNIENFTKQCNHILFIFFNSTLFSGILTLIWTKQFISS